MSEGPIKRPRQIVAKPKQAVAGGATRVRGRAASVVRPKGPPTLPISVRGAGDAVSEWHTRAVIDFVLRLGEALLVTGASVADTTSAVLRVCRAYGIRSVHADITYTSITLSLHRGVHRDPITVMRIISRFGTDYSRLQALDALVHDICVDRGDPGDVEDNLHELEYILDQPMAYRRGLITAAWAGMGAGVAALMGGHWYLLVIAALTTAAIDRIQLRMARSGISAFFAQMVGAMVAAGVAVVVLYLRSYVFDWDWLQHARPSIIVASSIITLLAGMSVVTAAQDTLDGFYVTASARTYEVILMTGGIIAGSSAMLGVAHHYALPFPVVPQSLASSSLYVRVAASGVIAAMLAVSSYCRPRAVAIAAVAGASSYVVYEIALRWFGSTPVIAAAVAAFAIGAVAPRVSRSFQVPSIAITTAGITPMLPGLAVYKGIMAMVKGQNGIPTLLQAAITALALSVGVSLGTLLGRQLATTQNSVTAKVLRRTVRETFDE